MLASPPLTLDDETFVSKRGCAYGKGGIIGVIVVSRKITFAESASFTLNNLKPGVAPPRVTVAGLGGAAALPSQ